ncbi:Tautomerase/MIF superfamily [Tylopilus felleus]|jgi:phenylpyruvate tautomerase
MPLITLVTNVKLGSEDETRAFVLEFTKFCSETIEKPEDRFSIDFNYNPYLAMKGSFEPAVRMHVMSLYNTTPENAQKWAEAFFNFFESRLGVPKDRGHFAFTDPGDKFIGVRGPRWRPSKPGVRHMIVSCR